MKKLMLWLVVAMMMVAMILGTASSVAVAADIPSPVILDRAGVGGFYVTLEEFPSAAGNFVSGKELARLCDPKKYPDRKEMQKILEGAKGNFPQAWQGFYIVSPRLYNDDGARLAPCLEYNSFQSAQRWVLTARNSEGQYPANRYRLARLEPVPKSTTK